MISGETLHSSERDRLLVIMAKAPRSGNVKTRLLECLPAEAVTELYRCLLRDTLALARSLSGVDVSMMCPECDVTPLSEFAGGGTRVVAQQGSGLAAGLTSVFAQFAASGRRRVIAFNSDSPHLPTSVLESAFENLCAHDVVVGPTHDGGYYLVGARAAYAGLFDGDGMGTTSALDRLLARAQMLGLSIAFTETFYDIDIEQDLARLAAELLLAPVRAPQTAEWLKQWQQAPSALRSTAAEL